MPRSPRIHTALAALHHAQHGSSEELAATRPTVVVTLSHHMRDSDLGCYGAEIATPNPHPLAAGGQRSTQYYNPARSCPPRASLLTQMSESRPRCIAVSYPATYTSPFGPTATPSVMSSSMAGPS